MEFTYKIFKEIKPKYTNKYQYIIIFNKATVLAQAYTTNSMKKIEDWGEICIHWIDLWQMPHMLLENIIKLINNARLIEFPQWKKINLLLSYII